MVLKKPLNANKDRETSLYFKKTIIFVLNFWITIMKRPEIVNRLREIIRKVAPDAKVILYGSEARGDADANSDIDLLILVEKENVTLSDQLKISGPLNDVEIDTGVLISPIIISRKLWENRPFKTPFYINVVNEGIEL